MNQVSVQLNQADDITGVILKIWEETTGMAQQVIHTQDGITLRGSGGTQVVMTYITITNTVNIAVGNTYYFTLHASENIVLHGLSGAGILTGTAVDGNLNPISINDDLTCSISASTALPVELTQFNGRIENEEIVLSWRTASEINNRGFEILRSGDGLNFTAIGSIDGKGTALQPSHYIFSDKNPLDAVNYYKLRQRDFDNTFHDSEVIAIDFSPPSISILKINENPFGNKLTLHWSPIGSRNQSGTQIIISDGAGRRLQVIRHPQQGIIPVQATQWPRGIYYVSAVTNHGVQTIPCTKQ